MPEGIWGFIGRLFLRRQRVPSAPAEPLALRPADSGAPLALEVRGLAKNFGGLKAVDGVDFQVRRGSVHALIGPNGSGKTTTLNVVTGLYRATAGAILVDGVDVTALPAHKRTAAGLARTFQNIRLFRSMTALENVVIGAERDGNGLVESRHDALRRRARAALDFVGLGSRANETIPSFSYGHQRLIEIARALAANPTVLLLDEPAAGLNSSEKKSLHDLLDPHRRTRPHHSDHRSRHDLDLGGRKASDGAQFWSSHRQRRNGRGAPAARRRRRLSRSLVMALLEVKDLCVSYGEIEALRGVSFAIDEGAVVTLLGSNGAGKSTTLRAISGLVAPRAGSILFEGRPISGLGPRAIVRLGVAHVPEGRRVFPGLTVRENIMLGASNGNASSSAIRREADAMFDIFPDIRRFADTLGWTLSGGQQQMVAVARGLMAKPRLLLLDEPSLGLAPVIVQAVFQIIAEIHKRGTTVLLVEQNAHMALKVANWGYVLETGRLALGGDPATLWSNEGIRDAYLGGAQTKAST